ncbi:MAG: hypothetical protein ABJA94_09585 [Rhodoglobus sp.]
MAFFQDAKSYVGVAPTDPNSTSVAVPSLGKGAQLVSGGGLHGCSALVPDADTSQFATIVVTIIDKSRPVKDSCDSAVALLRGLLKQS